MHFNGTRSRDPPESGSTADWRSDLLLASVLQTLASSSHFALTADRSGLRIRQGRVFQLVEFGVAARPARRGIDLINYPEIGLSDEWHRHYTA